MSETLTQTEEAADRIRGELVSTLRELDRRRQRVFDVRSQLKEHWPLLAAGTLGVLALGAGVALTVSSISRRRAGKRIGRERLQGLLRAWQHPDRLAHTRPAKQPFALELAKKVVLTVAGVAAGKLAQQASRTLLQDGSASTGSVRPEPVAELRS